MIDTKFELTFTKAVEAPPEDVYYAFATAQGWRDWLCDSARFEARPGGSYQLAWNNGWYGAGEVKECTRPERVALTWRGKDYPEATEITIELKGDDGKTSVEVCHGGFDQGGEWKRIFDSARKAWEIGLENLESIFSTGEDLRVIRRPMIGIMLTDFDEKIAREMGVPVKKGVRIERPIEGMGAESAGLQPNDVIVEMGGRDIGGFADLAAAFQGKRAGDVVEVVVYRGTERMAVEMELSRRPIEEFPLDPAAMAERLRPVKAEVMKDLHALFEGVSETEADFNPGLEEWSAKETLAHLIVSEHVYQHWIVDLLGDGERDFSEEGGNQRAQLTALLSVTPTIPELLDRLNVSKEETLTLLSHADALKARKGVLWRFGQFLLYVPGQHERSHIDQMRAAIEAARKS